MEKKTKIALISSFTADLLPSLISKELTGFDINLEWYIAPFNQVSSEVKSPHSSSKKFNPAIILLLFLPDDFLEKKSTTLALIKEYSQKFPQANILVSNAYLLEPQQLDLYKSNNLKSVYFEITKTNQDLIELVEKHKNVHLLDFYLLVSEIGRQTLFDPKFYYLAKIPFGRQGLKEVAALLTKSILAILGNRKKCLVLDLDNILWGGVLAEDGPEHLELDITGPGKAFYDFQRAILELYQSGIILAICSKNDEKRALKAIYDLPCMVLRENKFAAIRINWLDKAQNIKSIAQELNLGLSSFVFLDDTSFERSSIRKLLPEVQVPEMPADFSLYSSFLAKLPFFNTFSFTQEDSQRGEMYSQERKRSELKENAASFKDFLQSLHIKVSIKPPDKWNLPRIAQLTQKTNQFNLSMNRYQEGDITKMMKKKSTNILCLSAKDDLGDNGVVGVAILLSNNSEALLDTFLMSCRVLGRGIEEALISEVVRFAKKSGAQILKAGYNSTDKNLMVKTFLQKVGFKEQNGLFSLDLQKVLNIPSWITLEK